MKNKPPNAIEITLKPGDFYFGAGATRIRTLLGSCVSITAWHPQRLIGGMCHYLLPSRNKQPDTLEGKYADEAFELFIQQAARHKTVMSEYQIKIFGGGIMFPDYLARQQNSVSEKNIEAAHQIFKKHNLKIISQDVGTAGHRYIVFDIWSGNVWVRYQPLIEAKKRQ